MKWSKSQFCGVWVSVFVFVCYNYSESSYWWVHPRLITNVIIFSCINNDIIHTDLTSFLSLWKHCNILRKALSKIKKTWRIHVFVSVKTLQWDMSTWSPQVFHTAVQNHNYTMWVFEKYMRISSTIIYCGDRVYLSVANSDGTIANYSLPC